MEKHPHDSALDGSALARLLRKVAYAQPRRVKVLRRMPSEEPGYREADRAGLAYVAESCRPH